METIQFNGNTYLFDIEEAFKHNLLKQMPARPTSWEEYNDTYDMSRCNNASIFDKCKFGRRHRFYDTFNSEDEAKAFCALGMLIQLRDAWWGDWRPDWEAGNRKMYCIDVNKNTVCLSNSFTYNTILVFPTEEMCKDFLEKLSDLIEQAKMFL